MKRGQLRPVNPGAIDNDNTNKRVLPVIVEAPTKSEYRLSGGSSPDRFSCAHLASVGS